MYSDKIYFKDLSTLKFNNPEDILSFSEIHLEILKKLTSEPSELSMEKFFPSGQHNYFKTILQHISANSCSFYKRLDLYEELVSQLCGIIILSANSDERFQFMEKLLINTLLEDPKVWIGMLCVDVWIFVARNLHTSQVVRYYRFCRQILDEISSPLSYSTSTIFFEYLLQFFYKMINKGSYKEEKLLDARTKLHLGLEHQANKNDLETLKEKAKKDFVVLCEKFVSEDESSSNFDYKEMVRNFINNF